MLAVSAAIAVAAVTASAGSYSISVAPSYPNSAGDGLGFNIGAGTSYQWYCYCYGGWPNYSQVQLTGPGVDVDQTCTDGSLDDNGTFSGAGQINGRVYAQNEAPLGGTSPSGAAGATINIYW